MVKNFHTEKLFVILDTVVMGIYYQGKFTKLTIGGNSRFLPKMRLLLEEYFKIRDYKMILTAKNKVKLVCKCAEKKYLDTILQMHHESILMESTKNLNRIWW